MLLEELQRKKENLKLNTDVTLSRMEEISKESKRVADVASNSKKILADLDREFERKTGLQGNDINFLFAAIGLQVIRIVIMNEFTKIEKAGAGNRKEAQLHEFQEKLLGRFSAKDTEKDGLYYATIEHIITKAGVPYDATAQLTEKALQTLTKKGRIWNLDLIPLIPEGKLQLFKGANHRFATLGHDPLLGLIFGTANIMTNTISCVKTPAVAGEIQIPMLTTNHVIFTSDYKDPRIAVNASTVIMLQKVIERIREQPSAFIAALIKQITHIGTDLYTPCGIQIPAANLLLSNTEVEKLTQYISAGDLIKVGASAGMTELINLLISTLHTLMYDVSMKISFELYQARTRKIIMYSNMIATGSNILWTGGNVIMGNENAVKQMDIGGLLVTVKRLISDTEYIRQIKDEFVFGGFREMIQGKEFEEEVASWE